MPNIQRAKTAKDIYAKKRDVLDFKGIWREHFGAPEVRGSWFVYGHPANGKTSYLTQMARMLTDFGTVWYNGLEEGDSLSFEQAMKRAGLGAVGNKFLLIEDTHEVLIARIQRRNRPRFLIIDSLQVARINKAMYEELLRICDKKGIQLIIVGHAKGRKPEGRIGEHIEYLSYINIWVEGFKAIVKKSRYGGKTAFVIYPERAAEYWQEIV